MRKSLMLAAFAVAMSPALAVAQGATVGVAVGPPDEVVTYVQREQVPSVRVQEEVVVGHALPGTVELRSVPSHTQYGYAIVNDRRVIVEPSTRRVIRIIE
jgi:hypothetical protein